MEKNEQILKTRDDRFPVIFKKTEESTQVNPQFKLLEDSESSWIDKETAFGVEKIRPRLEPWLTALFQSEHFSLLVGSGLTHAVHYIAKESPLPGMNGAVFAQENTNINDFAKKSAIKAGRKAENIEDQIRVANELLRGLEILSSTSSTEDPKVTALRKDLDKILADFSVSILKGENGLITASSEKLEKAFNYLVSFLMSFASRTGTRDRLQIFTTNYDRFIEAGAEIAGLHLIDRFVGSLAPVFRSSRLDVDFHYNPPGIRGEPRYLEGVAKFTKLHGSLDWINVDKSIRRFGLPFGALSVDPYLTAPGFAGAKPLNLMIYPNAAKDRETAAYPYVDLFRDFAAAICRPNSTLVSFGYSFGDEHINRVIEDMLTIPSTHLVVISHSDPLGRIMKTYEKVGRHAQISLLLGNHLGDFEALVDNYLPKPAIDRTTFRMSELLKSRWGSTTSDVAPSTPTADPSTAPEL